MDRLAALSLGGALFGRKDQVIVLQEASDPSVAVQPQSRRRGAGQVGRDPLEILAHGGEGARWRGGLGLAVEILVQRSHRPRDPVEVVGLGRLQVIGSHIRQSDLAMPEVDHLVADFATARRVLQEERVHRR